MRNYFSMFAFLMGFFFVWSITLLFVVGLFLFPDVFGAVPDRIEICAIIGVANLLLHLTLSEKK